MRGLIWATGGEGVGGLKGMSHDLKSFWASHLKDVSCTPRLSEGWREREAEGSAHFADFSGIAKSCVAQGGFMSGLALALCDDDESIPIGCQLFAH